MPGETCTPCGTGGAGAAVGAAVGAAAGLEMAQGAGLAPGSGVHTPAYVIAIGSMLDSPLEGLGKFVELYGFKVSSGRSENTSSTSALMASGQLRSSCLEIWLPNTGFCASLMTAMQTGMNLEAIEIRKLAQMGQVNKPTMGMKFHTCHILGEQMLPEADLCWFKIRFNKRVITWKDHDQSGGLGGNYSTSCDYEGVKVDKEDPLGLD